MNRVRAMKGPLHLPVHEWRKPVMTLDLGPFPRKGRGSGADEGE